MELFLQPIDRYHCNIYIKHFFIFYELIAKAELDFNDYIIISVYKNTRKFQANLHEILITVRDFMIETRKAL